MFLLMQGSAIINNIELKAGELAAVKAGAHYTIIQKGDEMAVLFKSYVP
jgi:hypothetical protein